MVEIDHLGPRRGGERVGDEGGVVAARRQPLDGAHVAGVVADAQAGDAGGEQPRPTSASPDERMKCARHRRRARRRRWRRRAGVERRGVLLVVELQQRLGMGAVAGEQRGEVLEQHHRVGDRRAVVVAEAERRGASAAGRRAHRARAGGLARRASRSCSTAKPSSAWTTRSTSTLAPSAMPSRMRRPVKTGSVARRRARCHLRKVRWPSRVTEIGSVMLSGAPVDRGVVAIERRRRAAARSTGLPGRPGAGVGDHRLEPQRRRRGRCRRWRGCRSR